MYQLKSISRESIPAALEKAERYRLLNEPGLAESICSDILEIDSQNARAIAILILAKTDQFNTSMDVNAAKQLLPRLSDEYERHYYAGIICERKGRSILAQNAPGVGYICYDWLCDAMEHYEKAEAVRPQGNDDSILRWNTCARLINELHLEPRDEYTESQLE